MSTHVTLVCLLLHTKVYHNLHRVVVMAVCACGGGDGECGELYSDSLKWVLTWHQVSSAVALEEEIHSG